jgi:hypothetical protein
MSDSELARRLGHRPAEVRWARRGSGIPGHCRLKKWTKAQERWLGTASDRVVAQRLGRTERGVEDRRRRLGIAMKDSKHRLYTPADDRLLGTMPDEELARRLGRTPGAIEVRRVAFGIAMFGRHAASKAGKPTQRRGGFE